MTIIVVVLLVGASWLAYELYHAPVGYEDTKGFHALDQDT
jgi:hypothetical protein